MHYFEKNLLTSYSLSMRVAEKFMVKRFNNRRAFIEASVEILKNRVFSSYIVSDSFLLNQYEILAIPNSVDLIIYDNHSLVDYSYFRIEQG